MGRLFAKASSQYGELVTTVPSVEPISMSCWYKATDFVSFPILLSVSTGVTSRLCLSFTTGGAAQVTSVNAAGAAASKNTTTTVAPGVWAHACGVFTTNASRTAYLNAAGAQTDTTSIVLGAVDRFMIGCQYNASSRAAFANGIIAECGIWSTDLSATEINALAQGLSPLNIRPNKLVFYCPLYGYASPELGVIGGPVTLGAAPTAAEHPRVFNAGRSVSNVY